MKNECECLCDDLAGNVRRLGMVMSRPPGPTVGRDLGDGCPLALQGKGEAACGLRYFFVRVRTRDEEIRIASELYMELSSVTG